MQNEFGHVDVTVIGGGLAGMAASVHLAKAGLQVLCLEADTADTQPVGESLDWSAPDLLAVLGLPMQRLIDKGVATYKRHVTLKLGDGSNQHYVPGEWLGRPPFNVELRTLHVDRTRMNAALREIVLGHGVQMLHDKVVDVESKGRRVAAVTTAQGSRIASQWFIDASGSARLFPRAFNLPGDNYGPSKVAIWAYFATPESIEGTTLYADGLRPPYMDWLWEIPIHSNILSVGCVAKADDVKVKRQQGQTIEGIFQTHLARFPRFNELLKSAGPINPSVTSFRCRVHGRLTGPHWLIVGESAAMVDPMTSNGVTAALRHAVEASTLIIEARHQNRLPYFPAAMYSRRVQDLARFFNCGIEKVVYDGPIRNYIGVLTAGDVYTIPAWSLNSVYSRFRPRGVVSTLLFGFLLSLFRASATILYNFCKQYEPTSEVAG